MKITKRLIGDCAILELVGKLVIGPGTKVLREAIDEAARSMPRKIVLDLGKLTYLDSCGLGQMVGSLAHIQGLGGNLVLLQPPDKVMSLM